MQMNDKLSHVGMRTLPPWHTAIVAGITHVYRLTSPVPATVASHWKISSGCILEANDYHKKSPLHDTKGVPASLGEEEWNVTWCSLHSIDVE